MQRAKFIQGYTYVGIPLEYIYIYMYMGARWRNG